MQYLYAISNHAVRELVHWDTLCPAICNTMQYLNNCSICNTAPCNIKPCNTRHTGTPTAVSVHNAPPSHHGIHMQYPLYGIPYAISDTPCNTLVQWDTCCHPTMHRTIQ